MLFRRAMRPASCAPASYQRRQPEQTVLYRTIAAHLPAFLARTAEEDGAGGWPAFVRREFEAYLRCGILTHGFLRVRCERCGDTTVVGFSCKGRGFCPSCGGRRMSALAAHLVDRVLPPVPIRQWVFTVPVPVRYQLAFNVALTRAVLRVFLRTVCGWQRRATRRGLVDARSGSVTAIQRFLTRLHRRVRRLLTRRGRLLDADAGSGPFAAQEPLFAQTVAASRQGRVALGPRAGQLVRRLRSAAAATATVSRCAQRENVPH